jgi:Bacterial Ig-like domain (group 3)
VVVEPDRSATIFTGGGSKDPENIPNWAWKDGAGGLPDKDNLRHAFAARYDTAEGDVLYFGSDRFDNSGDAHQAFWFLQDEVTLGDIKSGGGFNFNGEHTLGDLLVISNFSNGGTVSTIFVYQWNPAVSGNLELLASSTAANCANPDLDNAPGDDPPGTNDQFCGIVNSGTITMPWSFTDKSNTPNNGALTGEFFEGGVNLSELGLADECFSSALAETRSSTSTTATLKDFVLGSFDSCEAGMTTQASLGANVTPGTPVTDTATITGEGTDNPPVPTGDVTFFLCGPGQADDIDPDEGCLPDTGTQVGTSAMPLVAGANSSATATSAAVNTATNKLGPGKYCFRAVYSGDDNYDPDEHTNATIASAGNGGECFTVKDTSSIRTEQSWLPQDKAIVTTAGGTAVAGTVVFSLYENGTCSGTAARTFTDSTVSTGGVFETNNTTYETASKTISWSATFTPSDTNAVQGSTTTRCERSDLTINNSASDFPPPAL